MIAYLTDFNFLFFCHTYILFSYFVKHGMLSSHAARFRFASSRITLSSQAMQLDFASLLLAVGLRPI
jgi:hypothetical protein